MQLAAVIITSLAWGLLLSNRLQDQGHSRLFPLFFATTMVAVLLGISGVIFFANLLDTGSALRTVDYVLYAVALISAIRAIKFMRLESPWRQYPIKWLRNPATVVLIVLGFYYGVSMLQPVQAWDALDHWAFVAKQFLEHEASGATVPFSFEHRHPNTLPYLMAWFASLSHPQSSLTISMMPWPLFAAASFLALYGYLRFLGASRSYSALFAYLLVATPLFENHVIEPGYADMLVNTIVIIAVILLAVALRAQCWCCFLLALCFTFMPVTLKNTGVYYALIPLSAVFVAACMRLSRGGAFFLWLAGISVGTFLLSTSWNVYFFGNIGLDLQTGIATFGSKTLNISLAQLPSALEAIWVSYFVNQSFSVWIGAGLIIVFVKVLQTMWRPTEQAIADASDQSVVIAIAFCFALGTMAASLLTDYGLRFGRPDNDTGHSRFSMPVAGLGLVLFATDLWSRLQTLRRTASLV